LVATWCEVEDVRGKLREYCHTFFGLGDGSALAFFQFVEPSDYDELGARSRPTSLDHIALKVTPQTQSELIERMDRAGVRHRLINHGYCRSLYTNDPDGLAVEFTADTEDAEEINRIRLADAHAELKRWLAGDRSSNNAWRSEHP
jgi:catechol-2,3-dioxygenase